MLSCDMSVGTDLAGRCAERMRVSSGHSVCSVASTACMLACQARVQVVSCPVISGQTGAKKDDGLI